MKISVYLRGEPKSVTIDNPPTFAALRQAVQEELFKTPIKVESGREELLKADEIHLFKKDCDTPIRDDEGTIHIDDRKKVFTAYEIFNSLVPVDLYRTVKLNQIHPAVRSSHDSSFASIVPLYCAALNKSESKFPHFYLDGKSDKICVRGVSLECVNKATVISPLMPWDEIRQGEPKGETYVDINHANFQDSYTLDQDNPFGCLHSTELTAGPYKEPRFVQKESTEQGNQKSKRVCFWRYKLKKGTNLQILNMSVICDKQNGHFTLIPKVNRSFAECLERNLYAWQIWISPDVYTPWRLLERQPREGAPQLPLPEVIQESIGNQDYVAFPAVAQVFQFFDMIMRGSGPPWDTKFSGGGDDGGQSQKKLGSACNVVFEHCIELPNTYEILCTLDALHASKFIMKSVTTFDFDVLHSTMNDIMLSADDDEGESIILGDQDREILIEGRTVVCKQLGGRLVVNPPLKDDPVVKGPEQKIARLG